MKSVAIVLGLSLLVPIASAQPYAVVGRQLASGRFLCDNLNNRYTYTIPAGFTTTNPFVVTKVQLWFGLDYNTISDFIGHVWRFSDGSTLADGSHDDYRNGGPERLHFQDWGGNVYTFVSGDQIVMDFSCSPGLVTGNHGAMGVWIWVAGENVAPVTPTPVTPTPQPKPPAPPAPPPPPPSSR